MNIATLDKLLARCTRNEIIYISGQLKKIDNSKGKRYYKLFNKLKDNPYLKVPASQKRYLLRMIMRVLLNYKRPLHSTPTEREKLEIARILYEKQLLEDAYKLLIKHLPKLVEKENWSLIVEYTDILINLIRLLEFDNLEKLQYFVELQEKAINIMFFRNKYNYLSSLVGNLFHKEGFSRIPEVKKKLKEILSSEELTQYPKYKDIIIIAQYYNINGIAYSFLGEYEKANKFFIDMLEQLNKNYPKDIRAVKLKLITYVNLCNNYLSISEYNELIKHTDNFIKTIKKYPQLVNTHIFTGFLSVFTAFNYKQLTDIKKLKELSNKLYENIRKFKQQEFLKTYKELIFVLSTSYFILKDYFRATELLKEFDKLNVPQRRDLVLLSNLLRLLIVYEEKDIKHLEHLLRKLLYKLKNHPYESFPLENVITKTLTKLLKEPLIKHRKIYSEALEDLKEIYEKYPSQKSYLMLIPIQEWLTARINNVDFRELLKANNPTLEKQIDNLLKVINEHL